MNIHEYQAKEILRKYGVSVPDGHVCYNSASARDWAKRTAPAGKRMGHAGAIISGGKGTAAEKVATLEACGISVAASPAAMAEALLKVWQSLLSRNVPAPFPKASQGRL